MMKRFVTLVLALVLVLALSACGQAPAISADEALNIALQQAGAVRDEIRNLENHLDRDNGVLVYEIDFDVGNIEYSYDINAETGAVVERDRERDD